MSDRYYLFQGNNYYPLGGWKDFHRTSHSVAEAQRRAEEIPNIGQNWAHVLDIETGEIVLQGKTDQLTYEWEWHR